VGFFVDKIIIGDGYILQICDLKGNKQTEIRISESEGEII